VRLTPGSAVACLSASDSHGSPSVTLPRPTALLVRLVIAVALTAVPATAQPQRIGNITGLPLPRFVSLGSAEVNVREGPGMTYRVAWTYVRMGYPVEIIQEFDVWRRVRDAEGNEGWVLGNLLSAERNAVINPPVGTPIVPVREEPVAAGRVVAQLERGVQASIDRCRDGWCRLTDARFSGWIEQTLLWGVYPTETVE
jgi:SH3-like domain-containing protein